MISRMLQGVEVKTDVDFCQHRNYWIEQTKAVLYTGCLDELMDYKLGELEYRALDFQTSCMEIPNYQGMAVINETGTDVAYTRTIEHKHFDYNNNAPFTIVTREYPKKWSIGMEPYYPINNEHNNKLHKSYVELLKHTYPSVVIGADLQTTVTTTWMTPLKMHWKSLI